MSAQRIVGRPLSSTYAIAPPRLLMCVSVTPRMRSVVTRPVSRPTWLRTGPQYLLSLRPSQSQPLRKISSRGFESRSSRSRIATRTSTVRGATCVILTAPIVSGSAPCGVSTRANVSWCGGGGGGGGGARVEPAGTEAGHHHSSASRPLRSQRSPKWAFSSAQVLPFGSRYRPSPTRPTRPSSATRAPRSSSTNTPTTSVYAKAATRPSPSTPATARLIITDRGPYRRSHGRPAADRQARPPSQLAPLAVECKSPERVMREPLKRQGVTRHEILESAFLVGPTPGPTVIGSPRGWGIGLGVARAQVVFGSG